MKKYFAIFGSLAVMVLFFQNCAQKNLSSTISSGNSVSVVSGKTDSTTTSIAAEFTKLIMWDNEQQRTLDADVKTGEVWVYEDYGNIRGARFCLTAADLNELQTLMKNSEVCIPTVDMTKMKDRVCSMAYQFPYATLANDKEEYRLGEKNNGCDEPIDLCGDRATMLRNYVTAMIKGIEAKACP